MIIWRKCSPNLKELENLLLREDIVWLKNCECKNNKEAFMVQHEVLFASWPRLIGDIFAYISILS